MTQENQNDVQRGTHIEDHEVEEDKDDMQHHTYHQLQLAHNCLGILQPCFLCHCIASMDLSIVLAHQSEPKEDVEWP